jgi:hypothetical protein
MMTLKLYNDDGNTNNNLSVHSRFISDCEHFFIITSHNTIKCRCNIPNSTDWNMCLNCLLFVVGTDTLWVFGCV